MRNWAAAIRDRLVFLLVALPFVTGFLEYGVWSTSARSLAVRVFLSGTILVIILLLRQARDRAARADSLRKTLNQAIIHDLKNPMTSIMGCISCILQDPIDPEPQRKLLQLALHSCRSQMALLETLVDTSRLEQGELTARREPVSVRKLLDDILIDTRGAAAHLGIDLKETIAPDLPDLSADEELLQRVLSNLIHNALKYTPAGGNVSVTVVFKDDGFRFGITDSGIGMSPKHLERLFDKYYRVEGSDQSTRRGSGLGLYFCRLAVEAHGGSIRVSSETDRGTTVTFDIPGGIKEERAA